MTKNYDNCVIDGDSSGLLRSFGQSYKLGYPAESIRRVYFPYHSFRLHFRAVRTVQRSVDVR